MADAAAGTRTITEHELQPRKQGNPGVTEIVEPKGRGHALTIDSGWHEVADTALAFVRRLL
jgi:non-heme chloroperoxidase